jgi:hypothetical protein
MVGMSSELRPFSFKFILGKRKKSQGAGSGEYGGWDTTVIFFGAKSLEWKGRCEQENCYGEETNHFEKAGSCVFSEVFLLIATKALYNRPGLPSDQSEQTQRLSPLPSVLLLHNVLELFDQTS